MISSPVPYVLALTGSRSLESTSPSPLAAAVSTTPATLRPTGQSPNEASIGRPSGSDVVAPISSPPSAPTSTSSVPSPPSATGHSSTGWPAASSASPTARATSSAEKVPLNESGAIRTVLGILTARSTTATDAPAPSGLHLLDLALERRLVVAPAQ